MGVEVDLIDELRAIAGVGKVDTFVVRTTPHPFEVRYTGGSSETLMFVASYDSVARADHAAFQDIGGARSYRRSGGARSLFTLRPLAISLRREQSSDVKAKGRGISLEYQTGDDAFDRTVYIDSPTTDPRVLAAVLGPNVRQGVAAMFAVGFHVKIDDENGNVTALRVAFRSTVPQPQRGLDAVNAFALILSDLPALTATGPQAKRPFWTSNWGCALFFVVPLTLGLFGSCTVAEQTNCIESTQSQDGDPNDSFRDGCGTAALHALFLALALGIVAAIVVRIFVAPRLRGHSDSLDRIGSITLFAFWITFMLTFAVASSLGYAALHYS